MLSTEHLSLGGPDNTRLNHAVKWLFEKVLGLSTAYLMLDGPDNTRLNHAVKWLFEKVLAVNCILDVRWT